MAFSGGWTRRQFYTEPLSDKLHTAAPEHSERDTADPNPVWDAPGDLAVLPDWMADYPDADWIVADTGGIVLDITPDSHDTYGGSAMTAPNEGASAENNFNQPTVQEYRERYLAARFEGLGESKVSDDALRRGLNADPINNPQGFRFGWVEQNFVDRKFMIGERFHDRRLVQVNTAYDGGDGAPVPSTSGNPFRVLARAITNVAQKPMIRREPVPVEQSETTDGADDTYSDDYPDWVAG